MSIAEVESIFAETGFRYTCAKPHDDGRAWATVVFTDRDVVERLGAIHDAKQHAEDV
ncbi:hypothetical protein ABZ953_06935 [Streptomyces sp. NPDC046465]|uniref:hypothetical protein n=1 Tax=Streptomyces sp. NPDC046465 TaxID=3155810 RepID=UPI003402CECC